MNAIMKYSVPLVAALLLIPVAALPAIGASKPNVIVILADDLGWADLSCYGSTFHESPHLDRLAAQGMRFTQAYSSSPYCSPSRAAIMTGRHPARLKITDYIPSNGNSGKWLPAEMKMELPLEEVTMAEVLREAGYATWHVGKWHLGDLGFYPEDQGFQVNIAGNHSGAPRTFFWPYGDDKGATVVRPLGRDQTQGYHGTPVPGLRAGGQEGEHLGDRLTSEAIKLIEQGKPGQPFFLYLPYYDVHTPIMAKPELVRKYQSKAAGLGLPSPQDVPGYSEENRVHGGGAPKMPEQQVNPSYAAMIETMDTNIGRLMAKLDERGLADNTLVLFTSDNGGHHRIGNGISVTSNRPLRGCKGWLYEGGVRVPWIVKWPGVTQPGSTCAVPVMNTDILPTVLDVCGLPAKPSLHQDGVSFAPLLRGETKPGHDAFFWHFPHYGNHGSGPCSSVRVGDWKLIHWIEDDRVELFHLFTDIGEKTDFAKSYPDRVQDLRRRLDAWRRQTNANMPRSKPADQALAEAFKAADWKSGLRLDLQRPIDPRLAKLDGDHIAECGLFPGTAYLVRSPAEVLALSGKLAPGDQLVLGKGPWKDAQFVFEGHGTMDAPILIRPEKPGSVVFQGESSVRFHGEHLVVHDLTFRGITVSQDKRIIFGVGNGEAKPADHCLFHRLRFEDCGSANPVERTRLHVWLMAVQGRSNTIARCTFRGLKNIGQMLGAAELPLHGLQQLHVLDNQFLDRPYLDNQNGYEVIQIGWSGARARPAGSLIQGNTFERCDGENELITLKASDMVVRNNRFLASQGVLCLRTARRVLVQDNLFDGQGRENTGGVRIQGDDHVLVGNTFRDLRQPKDYYYWPVSLMAADLETYGDTDALGGYGRAKNIFIVRNRFEGCEKRLAVGIYQRPDFPLLPQNIRASENIFTGANGAGAFDFIAEDPTGSLSKQLQEVDNIFEP
jgi:arylsulfatase A-like enzyme